jgi:hypothetical protein
MINSKNYLQYMKWKTSIIAMLLLFSNAVFSQIILDGEVEPIAIGYDFYTVQISNNETKYLITDTATNTFDLLNMDFSPFLTDIEVPEPFAITSSAAMQALYVSRTLFDCDSTNIEYAYYSTTNNTKPFRIVRTDGTVLLQVDSAFGPYCWGGCLGMSDFIVPIRSTSDGVKLFLHRLESGQQKISIYSLCGELPNEVFDFSNVGQTIIKVYPNPTQGLLTIETNPQDNLNEYSLYVFDMNGKEVFIERLSDHGNKYTLDLKTFDSGTYQYTLRKKNSMGKSGKFIITK